MKHIFNQNKFIILATLLLFYVHSVTAQSELKDSLAINQEKWRYESYILPAGMMAYGYISLFSDNLQSFDRTIKEQAGSDKKIKLDNYLIYAPLVSHGILTLSGVPGEHSFSDQAALYSLSTILNAVLVYPVKRLTLRDRPDLSDMHSFPSGHTSNAFVGAEFFWQEHKNNAPILAYLGYLTASVTGYLRIHNNKHWLSDVLSGAGTGIISTKLMYHFYPKIKGAFSANNKNFTVVPLVQSGFAGVFIALKIQ